MLDSKLNLLSYLKNNIKPIKINGSILHLDHNKHDRTGADLPVWLLIIKIMIVGVSIINQLRLLLTTFFIN